ncbi:MAG: hypothetical protein KatS3mg014_1249 [Actinomycetota bacterium]|nr:MAG: hypothetical protein KatS3mg014_1249 [Actinomycetota bacterium]
MRDFPYAARIPSREARTMSEGERREALVAVLRHLTPLRAPDVPAHAERSSAGTRSGGCCRAGSPSAAPDPRWIPFEPAEAALYAS